MFPEWEHQRFLIYNKENLKQCSQSTPIGDRKFDFNDTMTSFSEKLSSGIIESASENENQNSSSSDNETLPDSAIKQKMSATMYPAVMCRGVLRGATT